MRDRASAAVTPHAMCGLFDRANAGMRDRASAAMTRQLIALGLDLVPAVESRCDAARRISPVEHDDDATGGAVGNGSRDCDVATHRHDRACGAWRACDNRSLRGESGGAVSFPR
jgi:hypothetical protein